MVESRRFGVFLFFLTSQKDPKEIETIEIRLGLLFGYSRNSQKNVFVLEPKPSDLYVLLLDGETVKSTSTVVSDVILDTKRARRPLVERTNKPKKKQNKKNDQTSTCKHELYS